MLFTYFSNIFGLGYVEVKQSVDSVVIIMPFFMTSAFIVYHEKWSMNQIYIERIKWNFHWKPRILILKSAFPGVFNNNKQTGFKSWIPWLHVLPQSALADKF